LILNIKVSCRKIKRIQPRLANLVENRARENPRKLKDRITITHSLAILPKAYMDHSS